MPWAIAVREKKSGRIVLVEENEEYPEGEYESDMHVVPFVEAGDVFHFGFHDFTRTCPCGTIVKISETAKPIVVHTDRVN